MFIVAWVLSDNGDAICEAVWGKMHRQGLAKELRSE
jgi:hypothetical protein